MTRVACLLGSPRAGGNSDQLARAFCEAAGAAGAEVDMFALRDLAFRGCVGLRHCKTGGQSCGQDDDLIPVLAAVTRADILVMATPIYFCNISGLLKSALDRFFSFFVPDYVTNPVPSRLAPGKRFVLVQTQGEGAERYGDLLDQYGPALDKMGYAERYLIRAAGAREPGDLTETSAPMQKARALATAMAGAAS